MLKERIRWDLMMVVVIYFAVYGYNLNYPPRTYFDEQHKVRAAESLIFQESYSIAHPPLGVMLMSLGILVWGGVAYAWRIPALLSGLACIFLIYNITKRLTQNPRTAFLAALFFSLDGLAFTQARMGMLNVESLLFMLLALLSFIRHGTTGEWPREKSFFWTGLFLGLALGAKWTALGLVPVLGFQYWQLLKAGTPRLGLTRQTLIYLVCLPIVIYFTIFLIFSLQGKGLDYLFNFQIKNIKFHLNLLEPHPYASDWWSWPLMIQPVWYHFSPYSFPIAQWPKVHGILCIGNPVLFWAFPASTAYLVIRWIKKRERLIAFILIAFFSNWVGWALVERTKFFHYFYMALPYAVIGLAISLGDLWENIKIGKKFVIAYLTILLGAFIYWYPLWNGMEISKKFYDQHMWLKSWELKVDNSVSNS